MTSQLFVLMDIKPFKQKNLKKLVSISLLITMEKKHYYVSNNIAIRGALMMRNLLTFVLLNYAEAIFTLICT